MDSSLILLIVQGAQKCQVKAGEAIYCKDQSVDYSRIQFTSILDTQGQSELCAISKHML